MSISTTRPFRHRRFSGIPQRALPLDLHLFGYLRITIAGQVDKALALSDFEQVNQLRTPRVLEVRAGSSD